MKDVLKNSAFQFLPFMVILVGLILDWMHIDEKRIVFYIGFLLFGIGGMIFTQLHREQFSKTLRIQRMALHAFIAIVTIVHFVTGTNVLLFLLLGLFFYEIFIRKDTRKSLTHKG